MTKGDFYIGTGRSARWIGSIGHDAFDVPCEILTQINATMFEEAVVEFLEKDRDRSLIPSDGDGWAWPWDDSRLTDYVYMFDFERSMVIASRFGSSFYDPLKVKQGEDLNTADLKIGIPNFPIMRMDINIDGSYTTNTL